MAPSFGKLRSQRQSPGNGVAEALKGSKRLEPEQQSHSSTIPYLRQCGRAVGGVGGIVRKYVNVGGQWVALVLAAVLGIAIIVAIASGPGGS